MTGRTLPAVVVGGGVNALSIARSLGRRGIAVDVLADVRTPLVVRYSRYCRRYVETGRPVQTEWLEWLTGEGARDPAVLLPASDEGLELLARHRSTLVAHGHRPFEADDDVVLGMLDKARTYQLAAAAGVPAPEAHLLASVDDVLSVAERIRYPVVLKPQQSHVYMRTFAPEGKGRAVSSPGELVTAAKPLVAAGVSMLATELVPGRHDAYCSYYGYLDEEGQPLAEVTKRKLRQYPVGFGEGTYHEMAWEPEAAELGLRFFQAVGLRGLGNVEFKRDARDGALKLIECNARFTQADALLRRAGVDLPLLSYSRVVGWDLPAVRPQRNGLHLWFPRNDVKAFLEHRRRGDISTWEWVNSLAGHQSTAQFELTDPIPSLQALRGRLRAAPRKVWAMAWSRPVPA